MEISSGFKECVMNILNMKIYIPGKTVFDNLILSLAGPSHIISFLYIRGLDFFISFQIILDTTDNR